MGSMWYSDVRQILLLLAILMFQNSSTAQTINPDDLVLRKISSNHLLHFSNKRGSFWVGESRGFSTHFLMGYMSYRESILVDWKWKADGEELSRQNDQKEMEYYPHLLKRKFSGYMETVFMPDEIDGMLIQLQYRKAENIGIELYFGSAVSAEFTGKSKRHIQINTDHAINKELSLYSNVELEIVGLEDNILRLEVKAAEHDWSLHQNSIRLSLGSGTTHKQASAVAALLLSNFESTVLAKKMRMASLVNSVSLQSDHDQLNKAFAWALLSFDALNMNEVKTELGKGIYAGYPWFTDYWGRDSFIAMRALTITGQWNLVRENLESFMKFQILRDTTPEFGKVPNRARPGDLIYNTADATPRMLIELERYFRYSGDSDFIENSFPNISAALAGTIKYRMDKNGFIVHEDADTWMDAKGPKGAYSPRGNRAIDIQALWIQALEASMRMAKAMPENQRLVIEGLVNPVIDRVKGNFGTYFVNADASEHEAILVDALSRDDQPSSKIRPNALFALDYVTPMRRIQALEQMTRTLGTDHGIMSLAPQDEWFHPFHKYEPVYEQDASYHNGIVWVWNTGEWLSRLIDAGKSDLAWQVSSKYLDLMTENLTLGTLPELTDAMPREPGTSDQYPAEQEFAHISRLDQMSLSNAANIDGNTIPPVSGTFSQAWSLSEFIRNIIEDYAGIRISGTSQMTLEPELPSALQRLSLDYAWRQLRMNISTERKGNELTTQVKLYGAEKLPEALQFNFRSKAAKSQVSITIDKEVTDLVFVVQNGKLSAWVNEKQVDDVASYSPILLNGDLGFWDNSTYNHKRTEYKSQLD